MKDLVFAEGQTHCYECGAPFEPDNPDWRNLPVGETVVVTARCAHNRGSWATVGESMPAEKLARLIAPIR